MIKLVPEEISERYMVLSRTQVARALGISTDALDALHQRKDGPPRIRVSPRRYGYPADGLREWMKSRTVAA